jgi:hypothetical protein
MEANTIEYPANGLSRMNQAENPYAPPAAGYSQASIENGSI